MKRILQLLSKYLKVSISAMRISGTIGIIVSFYTFFSMDMMASVNYSFFYNNKTAQQIVNNASASNGIEHYAVGIVFLVVYCFIAIFSCIIATELFIRLCDLFDWKPKLYFILVRSEFKKECFDQSLIVKKQ